MANTAMPPKWEWLPLELQERIVQDLDKNIFCPFSRERFLNARLISKPFAAQLRHWPWLFCPATHPGFVDHFVDSVLRYVAKLVTMLHSGKVPANDLKNVAVYSSLYSRVYDACTMKAPNNKSHGLYCALSEKVHSLVQDGTLADIEGVLRVVYIRFVGHVFKFLDRFYVRRLSLPELKPHLEAAFQSADE